MAGNRLSFSIALNLLTQDFKKGANSVMASLKSMQYQVLGMAAAFGAGGFALNEIVSRMIGVARATNQARTALKNISGSAEQFTNNLRYLMGIANKYGQDLNTLTINFARFSAAGNAAGVSMQDQTKIFTSVTRAATAFGLSGEEANLTFMALQQMMAKGKISSEELRRQMGERMPIAMEAMAKAAGTNIQGLDKMLKQGELLSKDVLPKFADALTSLLPNVNTDNIETSVNRLKTAFTLFTDSTGIGNFFKTVVDSAAKALDGIREGTSRIVALIVGLVVGKLGSSVVGYYNKIDAIRKADIKRAELAELQKTVATQKRITAELALEEATVAYDKAASGEKVAARKEMNAAKLRLDKALLIEERAILAASEAESKASLVRSTTSIGGAFANIKLGAIRLLGTLRTLWSGFAPMAFLSAIGYVITRFAELRRNAKETQKIFSDYQSGLNSANGGQEAEKLRTLLKLSEQFKGKKGEINTAQKELMKMLGLQEGQEAKINNTVSKRLLMLETAAKLDYAVQSKMAAEEEIQKIYDKYGGKAGYEKRQKDVQEYDRMTKSSAYDSSKTAGAILGFVDKMIGGDSSNTAFKTDEMRVNAQKRVVSRASYNLDQYQADALEYGKVDTVTPPSTPDGTSDKNGKKDPLKEAEDKYKEGLLALTNRLAAGNIKQDEYNTAVSDLAKETAATIAGLKGKDALNNDVYKEAITKISPEESEFGKAQKSYNEKLAELTNLKNRGIYDEKKYNDELLDLYDSTILAVGAMNDIGKGGEDFLKALKESKQNLPAAKIEKGTRDTTFDYKKTERDKVEDELNFEEDYLSRLEKASVKATDAIDATKARIDELKKTAKGLEVKEDLDKLKKELTDLKQDIVKGAVGEVKNVSSTLSQITSAVERLNKAFSDTDASGWEQIVALLDVVESSVTGIYSVIDGYKELTEMIKMLGLVKKKETAATLASAAAKTTEAVVTQTTAGSNVAASTSEAVAATGAAAAKTWSAHAAIPFVGIAIAGAAIGAMIAMIASAKNRAAKYAGGGVVGGGSTAGDNVLVGLNSGEMVLNKSQQSNLFNALDSGTGLTGQSGKVVFEIQGKKLIGILEQERKRMNRL